MVVLNNEWGRWVVVVLIVVVVVMRRAAGTGFKPVTALLCPLT